jgi:hypothetical protein
VILSVPVAPAEEEAEEVAEEAEEEAEEEWACVLVLLAGPDTSTEQPTVADSARAMRVVVGSSVELCMAVLPSLE